MAKGIIFIIIIAIITALVNILGVKIGCWIIEKVRSSDIKRYNVELECYDFTKAKFCIGFIALTSSCGIYLIYQIIKIMLEIK